MGHARGPRPPRRHFLAIAGALVAAGLLPGVAAAHPLGNFTINHYAGISVTTAGIALDIVIDQAEIPAFQTRATLDTDGDGTVSAPEADVGRTAACADLASDLDLAVGGVRRTLAATSTRLSFPPGAGGLTTLRLECGYLATPTGGVAPASAIAFSDRSFPERIGWREIVVDPSVATIAGGDIRTVGVSGRLTRYPTDLLATPLDDRSVTFSATPRAVTPVAGAPAGTSDDSPAAEATESAASAAVPGGVLPGELPEILRAADLTPLVLVTSMLVAAALGAGHALTPGHGKTLMAAYLVGTRGTARHALGLGLSVTASHTLGILLLAAVIVGAQGILAPDVVVRGAPVAAAISIVAIGGWMLVGEIRRRRAVAAHAHGHELATPAGHDHAHDHEHDHEHDHHQAHDHVEHRHTHGGATHSHLPTTGGKITWRGLFALGLAGGLIPSTSALLILLGAIAAGRPALGLALIVAFGLGMALVMGGIGLALVLARGRLDRFDPRSRPGRLAASVPLVAAVVVLGFGVYLTLSSIGGVVTL